MFGCVSVHVAVSLITTGILVGGNHRRCNYTVNKLESKIAASE